MVSYKPLWHLLIDKNMKKDELRVKAQLNYPMLNRMEKGGYVSLRTLEKICKVLGCTLNDIAEFS